jgi:hypothetical protein
MFSVVIARSATTEKRKLEETLTWTESEITYKKINQGTICQELRLFRPLACQMEECTVE